MLQRYAEPLISFRAVKVLLVRVGAVISPAELFRKIGNAAGDDLPYPLQEPLVPGRVRVEPCGILERSFFRASSGQVRQSLLVQLPYVQSFPLRMEKGKLDRPVGEGPEVRAADLKNAFLLQGQPVLQEMPAGAAAEGLEPCDASGKQISVQKFRRLRGQAAAVIEPCRGIDQPFRRLLSSGIRAVSGQQGGSAVQKPGGRLLPVGECGADLRQL